MKLYNIALMRHKEIVENHFAGGLINYQHARPVQRSSYGNNTLMMICYILIYH